MSRVNELWPNDFYRMTEKDIRGAGAQIPVALDTLSPTGWHQGYTKVGD
jgi:hypothetical protein